MNCDGKCTIAFAPRFARLLISTMKTILLPLAVLPLAPLATCLTGLCLGPLLADAATTIEASAPAWRVGTPIVSYWAGPGFPHGGTSLNDAWANQLVEGGWNLVWCHEQELDMVQRHGLRGLLYDPLLKPSSLEDPKRREALAGLIMRVKQHPALYAYHLADEPSAGKFTGLANFVAYLREHDPAHLGYINLLPTYAGNEQLGTKGKTTETYVEYLRQYVEIVHPNLLSYDHYQFMQSGDDPQYFLNLALIREQAVAAGLPFMNIVQASRRLSSSVASLRARRVPNGEEMRYLLYTTLAYGAQGISYFVYCFPGYEGGIARPDGTPTPLYHALKSLNREFVVIAKLLQPLKSQGVFHAGMQPPGTKPLPPDSAFTFDPPVPAMAYQAGDRVQGVLLSRFGLSGQAGFAATHVLVVNLDYKSERIVGLRSPAPLDVFDAVSGLWAPLNWPRAELRLPGGGGKLTRVRPSVQR